MSERIDTNIFIPRIALDTAWATYHNLVLQYRSIPGDERNGNMGANLLTAIACVKNSIKLIKEKYQ